MKNLTLIILLISAVNLAYCVDDNPSLPISRLPAVGPDGLIVDFVIMQVNKNSSGEVVIQHIVGINGFEQVSYIANGDDWNNAIYNIKLGPQYVNNYMARVSNVDSVFKVDFERVSAGSALVLIGRDKTLKQIGDLPLGLFPGTVDVISFALIARVTSDKIIPTDSESLKKWADIDYIKKLIADGGLVINK